MPATSPLGRLTLAIDPTSSPYAWGVLRELLDHAGFFVHETLPALLAETLDEKVPQIVVLAGRVSAEQGAALSAPLAAFVERGGAVVGLGGAGASTGQSGPGVLDGLWDLFGLDPVPNASYAAPGFGMSPWETLGEGWLRIKAKRHPVLAGLEDVPLHVFGGQAVRARRGTETLASVTGLDGKSRALAALSERRAGRGKGLALFVAADLPGSAAYIRTGRPVAFDAPSAPDGSAPLCDGLLKAEDGMVLDFLRDRSVLDAKGKRVKKPGPGAWPIFDQPVADALAQVLIRAIGYAALRTGVCLPRLWYHPDGLEAVAHCSHDTDGNDPALAETLFDVMRRADIRSSWCTIHPGYDAAFYAKLKNFGHEIALHYDAMGGPHEPFRRWGSPNFDFQFRWLLEAAGLTGMEPLVTNKNHYTRWEDGLEFLEWCAHQGVRIDQSKGPSKRGTIGYPFGSCHPHFLYDVRGRRIDVLEQAFQSQDLAVTAPPAWGRLFVDRARRWNGVCHLLFHPAHFGKEGVAESLLDAVAYGKKKGLRWVTARELNALERARRACVEAGAEYAEGRVRVRAPQALPGATLQVLGGGTVSVNVKAAKTQRVRREGLPWTQIELDVLEGACELS